MRGTFAVTALLLLTAPSAPSAIAQPVTGPTAQGILDQVAAKYAGCTSYSDEGVATIVFNEKTGKRVEEKPFATRFVRPDFFRFDYRDRFFPYSLRWSSHIVSITHGATATWPASSDPDRAGMELWDAVGTAAGVSGGASYAVPRLLLPNPGRGRSVAGLQRLTLAGDERVRGRVCYHVVGFDSERSDEEHFLIDKSTLLILRIDKSHRFSDFDTLITTSFHPILNPRLAASAFDFDRSHPVNLAANVSRNLFWKGRTGLMMREFLFSKVIEIWLAIIALYYMVIALRGLITRRVLLMSVHWYVGLSSLIIPAAMIVWLCESGFTLPGFGWAAKIIWAILGLGGAAGIVLWALAGPRGYVAYGVNAESFRSALTSVLGEMNIAYQDFGGNIHLVSEKFEILVPSVPWLGTAGIRVRNTRNRPLLRSIAERMRQRFRREESCANLAGYTAQLAAGVIMIGFASMIMFMI